MTNEQRHAARYLRVIDAAIMSTTSGLDYRRVLIAVERLANLAADSETDDTWWSTDARYGSNMGDLLAASYWHLSNWHGGQWSDSYRALCAVGRVFSPGMTDGPEPDTTEADIYNALDAMAGGDA